MVTGEGARRRTPAYAVALENRPTVPAGCLACTRLGRSHCKHTGPPLAADAQFAALGESSLLLAPSESVSLEEAAELTIETSPRSRRRLRRSKETRVPGLPIRARPRLSFPPGDEIATADGVATGETDRPEAVKILAICHGYIHARIHV